MKCIYKCYDSAIDIDKVMNCLYVTQGSQPLTGKSFEIIQQAIKEDQNYLKYCFDRIDIVYDELYTSPLPCYKVNNNVLPLSELSSGERDYLYALCCKKLNKKFILYGTLDRLDKCNKKKFIEDFKDYDCVIIVMNKVYTLDFGDIDDIEDIVVR